MLSVRVMHGGEHVSRESILVVDDDPVVVKYLRASLRTQGWHVLTCLNGAEALQITERERPDIMILDIMMPKMDGFDVCRRLREWSQIPVIVLSVRSDMSDKVQALNLGADDYLTKPFALEELVARINSVLRRVRALASGCPMSSLTVGDLTVDTARRTVMVGGREVKVTPTEYALVQELVVNANKVLTHQHLLTRVWGPEYRDDREYLHVFINRVRAKLEPELSSPRRIVTVPGVGYMLGDAGGKESDRGQV
jgi:two-component system KDP operon response regulator KdpE